MNLYLDFLERLQQAVNKSGNMNRFAESIGVQPNLITRWLKRERVPSLTTIQPVADKLGLRFTTTQETQATAIQEQATKAPSPLPPRQEEGEGGENVSLGVYTAAGGDIRNGKAAPVHVDSSSGLLSSGRSGYHDGRAFHAADDSG